MFRAVVSLVLCASVFAGMSPAPVAGYNAEILKGISAEEVAEAISLPGLRVEQVPSTPSDWGKIGQHTSVVGWTSSLSYALRGGEAGFSLHIYAARNEQPANVLFAEAIGELEQNSDAGLVFTLTPEMAYGVENSYQVVVLFRQDDGVTASVMRWVPVGTDLVMVEVTVSEQTEEALPDPAVFEWLLLPVVKLLTEKLRGVDPSAQLI